MKKELPSIIPVFPLSGVIYFPQTNLPLNIFENRYLSLVMDTLKKDKLMGMIQAKKDGKDVYRIGCLGEITDFKKTEDGRMLINLTGITRFEIKKEVANKKAYREFEVDYSKFTIDKNDLKNDKPSGDTLLGDYKNHIYLEKMQKFFKKNGLLLNWKEFEKLSNCQRINTLSMIAPISNEEKQKLIESISLNDKAKNLEEIIDFYLYDNSNDNRTLQ